MARLFRLRYERFPVMDLIIEMGTAEGFTVRRVTKINDPYILPYELRGIKSENMPQHFMRWYRRRLISEESPTVPNIAYLISGTENIDIPDPYAFIVNASLLSYGRTLTDKYWLAPATKNTVFYSGIKNCALNGREMLTRDSYAGMDYLQNDFNVASFRSLVKNGRLVSRYDFNSPCLCIPGRNLKIPVIDARGSVWIEKYSDRTDAALEAHRKAPHIFPQAEVHERGYSARCLTSVRHELVHLTDLIAASAGRYDRGREPDIKYLDEALAFFLSDPGRFADDIKTAREIFNDDGQFVRNSGFLVDKGFGEIIGFKAWI